MVDVLDGVDPLLVAKIGRVLMAMKLLGFPMKPVQGLRTAEQQHTLWLQRPVVTHADGTIVKSNHQARANGLGGAVDCCFEGPDPWGETQPWAAYGACVEAVGLVWGGGHTHGWQGQDRPHAQLPV